MKSKGKLMKLLDKFNELIKEIHCGSFDWNDQEIENILEQIDCVCYSKKYYKGDLCDKLNCSIDDLKKMDFLPKPHQDKDGYLYWTKRDIEEIQKKNN